jgi:hypothetical protein
MAIGDTLTLKRSARSFYYCRRTAYAIQEGKKSLVNLRYPTYDACTKDQIGNYHLYK